MPLTASVVPTAAGMRFDYSDGNTRDHLTLASSVRLHEASGFRLGLRYAYASADERNNAYWTPFELQRYFIEAAFRGNHLQTYYHLYVRLGRGRERVRPEARREGGLHFTF